MIEGIEFANEGVRINKRHRLTLQRARLVGSKQPYPPGQEACTSARSAFKAVTLPRVWDGNGVLAKASFHSVYQALGV